MSLLTAAFIDVETTGFSNRDEIIEFAIALFQFYQETGEILTILESYTGLREPKAPIHPRATAVHGIREDHLIGRALDEKRIQGILDKASFLIAHNASFDRRFVRRLFPQVEKKEWLCSMNGIDWKREGFSSKSLEHLLESHQIGKKELHRAHLDVAASIELLSLKNSENKTYLYQMLARS